MTPGLLFWLALGGVALTTFAATGAHVLNEFAKHDLEEYCERQNKKSLFGTILDLEDRMTLGAQTLRVIAATVTICAAIGWLPGNSNLAEYSVFNWFSVVAMVSVVMLAATSWIPYGISRICAVPFLFRTWRIWSAVSLVFWPLMVGSQFVRELVQRATGSSDEDEDEEEALEDEIRSIVSEGEREGLLDEDEREMIEGVIELDEKDVGSIMTPRSRVDSLDVNTEWSEMLEFVVQCGRTRIPVFEDRKDNIVGILYTKDLLRESLRSESKRKSLVKLLREPIRVPETKLLDEMLEEFRNLRIHLAVVRGEYGKMIGVVTIEDVLEEIVGEIVDETDNEQRDEICVTSEGVAEVQGVAHIELVNEVLGLQLPEGAEFDTIGGLIMNQLKEVPRVGRQLVMGNATFTIKEASRRAIDTISVVVSDANGDSNSQAESTL